MKDGAIRPNVPNAKRSGASPAGGGARLGADALWRDGSMAYVFLLGRADFQGIRCPPSMQGDKMRYADSLSSRDVDQVLPDYRGGSIVNLMASIRAARGGGASRYPALRDLDGDTLRAPKVLVLLVVDGLGDRFLSACGKPGVLHRHRHSAMTSVFPSTTATAITTYLTGEAPLQHGLTGWFMHFSELGGVHAVLPLTPRRGAPAPHGQVADVAGFFGHVPFFDQLDDESVVISPATIVDSPFNRVHAGRAQRRGFTSMAEFFELLTDAVRGATQRRYVYAYWSDFDRLAHEFGVAHGNTLEHFAQFDAAFGRWYKTIAGTEVMVLATADHGFIDIDPERAMEFDAHSEFAGMLRLPLCGERRVAYCYVEPAARESFRDYVSAHLAECAELYEAPSLLQQPYFGLGEPHTALADRVGDFVLIMKHRATIKDWLPGEPRYTHVGVHGGTSAEEMLVPLIVMVP